MFSLITIFFNHLTFKSASVVNEIIACRETAHFQNNYLTNTQVYFSVKSARPKKGSIEQVGSISGPNNENPRRDNSPSWC